MLSRVASSIYWMNRYIERAENYARFIDVNLNLLLELPAEFEEQWAPLIKTTGDETLFFQNYSAVNREDAIYFLTFDKRNPNSIFSCVEQSRENARSIREGISSEMWEQLNALYLNIKEAAAQKDWEPEDLFAFYDMIKKGCYLFSGISHSTLSHNDEWQFAQLGRFLERVDKISRLIDVKYYYLLPQGQSIESSIELIQWIAVLRSTSAFEMYKRESASFSPQTIAEFLILNPTFPRTLRYSLTQAQKALHAITGNPIGSFKLPLEKKLGRLKVNLDYIEIDEIFEFGLHDYLDKIQMRTNEVGDLVFETFFSLPSASPHIQLSES